MQNILRLIDAFKIKQQIVSLSFVLVICIVKLQIIKKLGCQYFNKKDALKKLGIVGTKNVYFRYYQMQSPCAS